MPAYTDTDGIPATGDRELITGILRGELGFDGLVVSDYYAVSFLELRHAVAGTQADAAAYALEAGVDVELPSVRCYGAPLESAVREGRLPSALVDRAVGRVLRQKCELGMLDPGWTPLPATPGDGIAGIDLDPAAHRALAHQLASTSPRSSARCATNCRGRRSLTRPAVPSVPPTGPV